MSETTEKPAEKSREREFLEAVLALDRGERAILRRNAGNSLAEARGCTWFYRLVPPAWRWTQERPYAMQEEIAFLVATLACRARYPERALGAAPEFGRGLARLAATYPSRESIDRRFGLLLDARLGSGEDLAGGELAFRLRQFAELAASKDVVLPWVTLLKELPHWDHPRKWVQKKWAREFYDPAPQTNPPAASSADTGQK
jgi:CRISPR type I-E-associated protein CasB/Cse2